MNVHIRQGSERGTVVFDRLIDEGRDRLEFQSGTGWVAAADLLHNGWVLCDGWAPPHSTDCPRINYPVSQLPGYCNCGR